MTGVWPATVADEQQLDELLTQPDEALVQAAQHWQSPLLVLGAGGKMGPSLAVLAQRACVAAGRSVEVIAVSRFREPESRRWLEERGVRTLGADLRVPAAVADLPATTNLIYLVGMKFGTATNPGATWIANTWVPALVAQRFPGARWVVLSTGNVYPLVPVESGGSRESDPLTPQGEYAYAAVARERIVSLLASENQSPLLIMRLNYAVDLRYGVLVDLAQKIMRGEPIELTQGHFNTIWQGDANSLILRGLSLASLPPRVLNLTSPEILSVREVATQLAAHLERPVQFTGQEASTALVSNTAELVQSLGRPAVSPEQLIAWVADWTRRGGRMLGRPTHFEVRDGRY